MITHPGELVATFLLPLPDAIPLKDGTTFPTYRPLELATIQVLEPWIDQLKLQRLDEPGVLPCSQVRTRDKGQPVENWSNKNVLVSSIQFHQTFSDAGLRLGLESALRLAKVISGPMLTLDEKAEALEDLSVGNYLHSSSLREFGLGSITVAECYVGLRIVGDLPDLEEPLVEGGSGDAPFGPLETERIYRDELAMWQWRISASGSSPDPALVERRLRAALDIALGELRGIQHALQALRPRPTMISSLERLPVLIPVVLRRAGDVGNGGGPSRVVMLMPHPHFESLLPPDPLSDNEMWALGKARHQVDGGVFSAYLDVHREATVAMTRTGDHRLAGLLLGVAAESLIDELILHLAWEEGRTPEDVAQHWVAGLDARIHRELPTRLGGPWDVTRRNPIGVWAQDVAALRHRVAHAAYLPSEAETTKSFEGLSSLVSHFCDRLARPDVMMRYPRTALALAGAPGLKERDAYTRRIRELEHDPSEVNWSETFYRWREAWRRTRQDLSAQRRTPDLEGAYLVAVRHLDRSLAWVLHDREQHLATQVTVDESQVPPGVVEQVHTRADAGHHAQGYPLPVSSVLGGPRPTISFPPEALWVEEYHHLPLAGVMIDHTDYTQPTHIGVPLARP